MAPQAGRNVLSLRVLAFVSRTMVAAKFLVKQANTGHRQDLVTYVTYAGSFDGYGLPATRAWFANIRWHAFTSYFGQ